MAIKAFPTAYGFGREATGGRGGAVVKVTNLNDSGAGSLREALMYTSGARTIVFEVGGTITLNSILSITNGNVTVAGQTAPGDGILIKGSTFMVESSNVIIRYMRFRPGITDAGQLDALSITAWNSDTVENVVIDHCSLSWAEDENFDIRVATTGTVRNITIQNSIISESGYGALAGPRTSNLTYHNNLFAHNQERNIHSNYPTDGIFRFEMINNLIYGCYGGTGMTYGMKFTILNNHYKESSQQSMYQHIIDITSVGQGTPSETYAYISGNIVPDGKNEYNSTLNPYIESTPYASSGIIAINANQVADSILSHVGASLPNRDAVDVRLINQYNANNGSVQTSGIYPTIANGVAPTDSNDDGIPDLWSTDNIPNGETYNTVTPSGYTWLEKYLNQVD